MATLVLHPFNCLKGLPLAAPLRQSAMAMLREQREEWQSRDCGYSLGFYLSDRFFQRAWTQESIARKWDAFVEQENLEQPGMEGSNTSTIRRGWLAVSADQQNVMGEIKLTHYPHTKTEAQPFIFLRPRFRGAKLGYDLMQASFALAARAGYTTLKVGHHNSQLASAAMMKRLQEQGRAEYLWATRNGSWEIGKMYRVQTAAFE
jgi:GNAT superfamily N-acetyltransferase